VSSSFFFNINPKLKRGKKEKTKKTNKKGNTTPLLLERERDGEERRAARTHFLHAKSVEKESLDDDDRCSSLATVGSVGVHRRGRGRWRRRDADGKDSRNRPQDTDDFDDDVAIEDGERKSDVDENEIATDGPRE